MARPTTRPKPTKSLTQTLWVAADIDWNLLDSVLAAMCSNVRLARYDHLPNAEAKIELVLVQAELSAANGTGA